jgi:hypothetical protein
MIPPTRTRFDSPVDLPYGMALEGARGQLKVALNEASHALSRGAAHMTVAGVIRTLIARIRTLEGTS